MHSLDRWGRGLTGVGRDALRAEGKGSNSCSASDPFATEDSAEGASFCLLLWDSRSLSLFCQSLSSSASSGLARPGADPGPKSLTQTMGRSILAARKRWEQLDGRVGREDDKEMSHPAYSQRLPETRERDKEANRVLALPLWGGRCRGLGAASGQRPSDPGDSGSTQDPGELWTSTLDHKFPPKGELPM